jgi:hypothetical protein
MIRRRGARRRRAMRGDERSAGDALFRCVSLEARVPASHPLRLIRAGADAALEGLSPRAEARDARTARPSVPLEKLIRAWSSQAFFGVRSERQPMQQRDDNQTFRWFVGLSMDAPVRDATTFTETRDRLPDAEVTRRRRWPEAPPNQSPAARGFVGSQLEQIARRGETASCAGRPRRLSGARSRRSPPPRGLRSRPRCSHAPRARPRHAR